MSGKTLRKVILNFFFYDAPIYMGASFLRTKLFLCKWICVQNDFCEYASESTTIKIV